MGFLSFNEKCYAGALKRLEGRTLDDRELYEVKQLLKLLDDLLDEGYTELNRTLEEKYNAVSRLRDILSAHKEEPFSVQHRLISSAEYSNTETETEPVVHKLMDRVNRSVSPSSNPFLADLRGYCEWIGWRPDTAYVFLLRDAFLPYLYYRNSGRDNLYPWVVNRDFLRQNAGTGADDILRLPVYEALESGVSDYGDFSAFCKARIREALKGFSVLENALRELLYGIRERRILVIESGYCGTIPLTLSALDERVDFRLYTTAPYLYEIYRDKIFCRRYERIRSFETLYSQDVLMKYSSFRNGRFYIRTATEDSIWEKAADEALGLLNGNTDAVDEDAALPVYQHRNV